MSGTVIPGSFPGAPAEVAAANPMLSNAGPASWARRAQLPDYTVHGTPKIRPLRAAPGFSLDPHGPDPRGMAVVGGDGVVAGTVAEVWVDTAEPQVRYYEVELLAGGRRVLLPYGFARVRARERQVRVKAIHAAHFADVPGIASPDVVTLREEDQVMAYYAGGYLWADPSRAEPLL